MKTDTHIHRISNDLEDCFPNANLSKYQSLDLAIKIRTLEVLKQTLGYSEDPVEATPIPECLLVNEEHLKRIAGNLAGIADRIENH